MPENAVIFIAEDNDEMRRMLKTMLKIRGHSVVLEADSLKEALEGVKEVKTLGVNVAIVDGSLDGQDSPGDGPKVAEALRKEIPTIKIVSFSGASKPVTWGDYNPGKSGINKLPSLIRSI